MMKQCAADAPPVVCVCNVDTCQVPSRRPQPCCCMAYCTCSKSRRASHGACGRTRGCSDGAGHVKISGAEVGRRCESCLPERAAMAEEEALHRQEQNLATRKQKMDHLRSLSASLPRSSYRANTAELLRRRNGNLYQRALNRELECRRQELQEELIARREEMMKAGSYHNCERAANCTVPHRGNHPKADGDRCGCAGCHRRPGCGVDASHAGHIGHNRGQCGSREQYHHHHPHGHGHAQRRTDPFCASQCPCCGHPLQRTNEADVVAWMAQEQSPQLVCCPACGFFGGKRSSKKAPTSAAPKVVVHDKKASETCHVDPCSVATEQQPCVEKGVNSSAHRNQATSMRGSSLAAPAFGRKVLVTNLDYIHRRSKLIAEWEEVGALQRVNGSSRPTRGASLPQRLPKWRVLQNPVDLMTN